MSTFKRACAAGALLFAGVLALCVSAQQLESSSLEDSSDSSLDSSSNSSNSTSTKQWYPPWLAITATSAAVAVPALVYFAMFFCATKHTAQ